MRKSVSCIKESYPDTVIFVKSGSFYRCYDKDSYIIAYFMDYQVKATVFNDMAGFPTDSLNKVLDKLERNRISYKIFSIEFGKVVLKQQCDFKEDNCYEGVYIIANKYIKIKNKITKIAEKLYDNMDNIKIEDVISKVEKIVYDDL